MDALVTAGGTPEPGEPLYEYTQGKSKALLDICGKPMIQWVLDALCGAETVENIVIIGLSSDTQLVCSKKVVYITSQGSMLDNLLSGMKMALKINPESHHTLVVSSDIPTITPEMVDWVVNNAMKTDHDAYYHVVTRQTMEARFPGSKRTYTKLKGIELCGGDMNVIRTTLSGNEQFWSKVIAARKNPLKQAALLGYDTLLLLLLRLVDLEGAVNKVTKRIHITGKAIISPYAEIGMDVDKPHQLELVRADLSGRA
jgi:GTP:adenosylcobinamide-phosphate guanylyltransferase